MSQERGLPEALDEVDWRARKAPRRRFRSQGCFVCGAANPVGFQAYVFTDDRFAWIESAVPPTLQGFDGITHGGAVAALLDEAMWYAVYVQGVATLTVELTLTLRRPISPGERVTAEAIGVGRDRRFWLARARLLDAAGELAARATGRFLAAPGRLAHLPGILIEEPLDPAS